MELGARCHQGEWAAPGIWREIPRNSQQNRYSDARQSEVGCLMTVDRPLDGFVEFGNAFRPPALFTLVATATSLGRDLLMQLPAPHQALGDVGRLQCRAFRG